MKRLIKFVLIFTLLSCNKIFHEEELSIGEITSEADLELAVNGIYAKMTSLFTSESGTGVKFFGANSRADDLASTLYPDYNYYYSGSCDREYIDNEIPTGPWSECYDIIITTNNIIMQFELNGKMGINKKHLVGEAYFFRAYIYFWLTRTYGRIPLVKNIDINYNIPLADFADIYEFIETDLKTAMALLPRRNNEARIPYLTVHRGTTKAFLAELYLNWAGYPIKDNSKYALAAQTAGEIIDSAEFFGFGLEEDFAQVWEEDNHYNRETILALYFSTPEVTSESSIFFPVNSELNTCYTGFNTYIPNMFCIEVDTSFIYLRYFPSEINFYNAYPKNYRREITFFTTMYVPGYYVRNIPTLDSMYVEVKARTCARPAYRKFYYTSSENILSYEFCKNTPIEKRFHGNTKIYLYRYAQTVLTYAEAAARSGQMVTSKAYEAVNQIRRRAYNVDIHNASQYDIPAGLSAEAFADSVVQESAWELAGEPDGRWFDLVRLEKVEEALSKRNPKEGGFPTGSITKDDYFLAIPEGDRNLNPNLIDE